MYSRVVGQLGMEGGPDDPTLPHRDDPILVAGQHFDARLRGRHDRGPDEDPSDSTDTLELQVVFEAVHLGAEGIASNGYVQDSEPILIAILDLGGKENHPHACAPYGHALAGSGCDCGTKAEALHEEADRRALAARNDQAIDGFELLRDADEPGVTAGSLDRLDVLGEVSLDAYDADQTIHGGSVYPGDA